MPYIRGTIRLFCAMIFMMVLGAIQTCLVRFHKKSAREFPLFIHGGLCKILGIDIKVTGTPTENWPVLYVANHSSYIDILVMGSLARGAFIAKSEIKDWPMFGWLAAAGQTIFVVRKSGEAVKQKQILEERMQEPHGLILFPEGTTTDNKTVLPFKSSLFSIVEKKNVMIQPVSITCTKLDEIPVGRAYRSLYAWYGDMDLMPHLWELVRQSHLTVEVKFHEPFNAAAMPNRKAIADKAWRMVAEGVSASLTGRSQSAAFTSDLEGTQEDGYIAA